MRFFDCSRCLSNVDEPSDLSNMSEGTNPLVTTKRPVQRQRSKGKIALASPGSGLLAMVRSFRASWKRGKQLVPRSRPEMHRRWKKGDLRKRGSKLNGSKSSRHDPFQTSVVGKIYLRPSSSGEILKTDVAVRVAGSTGNGSGRSELEREYYEHLEALKFLIEPPACFRNDESRQNFENKLNTLDFKRMNTVAIPEIPIGEFYESTVSVRPWNSEKMKNPDTETRKSAFGRFCAEKIEESLSIERSVIDLFVRAPILKNRKVEAVRSILFDAPKESKTVRFKDENDGQGVSDEQRVDAENMNAEAKENGLRREVSGETVKDFVLSKEIDVGDESEGVDPLPNDVGSDEKASSDGNLDGPVAVAKEDGIFSNNYLVHEDV